VVTTTTTTTIPPLLECSVECLFSWDGTGTEAYPRLVSSGDPGTGAAIQIGVGIVADAYVFLIVGNGTTQFELDLDFGRALVPGVTHYVAATVNGDTLTLTVDRQTVTQTITSGSFTPGSAPFLIGASDVGGSNANFFSGTIAEVAVYAIPLSPAQIADHYAAANVSNPAGVVNEWLAGGNAGPASGPGCSPPSRGP